MASPSMTAARLGATLQDCLPSDDVIFGTSEAMTAVRRRVEKVAGTNVSILIQGATGTGKELIARALHHKSPWSSGPFVKVSCAAIPGALLESELFGYEKGAFTGALTSKPGRVEQANGGTLFLDEIAEIDLGLQAKLLQLLQESRFWRIGGREDTQVSVRVICATSRDLETEILTQRFRQDLFYRINVVNIQLPPLRERSADIPILARHFEQFFGAKYKLDVKPLSNALMRLFEIHTWPGNIREFGNLIERYVILGSEDSVREQLDSTLMESGRSNIDALLANGGALKGLTRQTIWDAERKIILRTLEAHRWNRKQAAKELDISYRTLLYKIRQAGLGSRKGSSRVPEIN
jgi:two-component system response regulator AtoC